MPEFQSEYHSSFRYILQHNVLKFQVPYLQIYLHNNDQCIFQWKGHQNTKVPDKLVHIDYEL